ncbi:DUF885 family protein [Streptantibioticus silvisoli]|uniref:DUF885 family protein n=1 Tax=Streptantibioticus silvisoli TaxID=2705255 RepID=A0ABT6VWC3_9ACTN|nr:DUF885 family protein [Streptantibioticus silvisoli]MDI5962783.1 DUF885 family protein [Streptantibioticus silvisoli]
MDNRMRAVCDLNVSTVREMAGRHEYDGVAQDLSPDGVRRSLAALARARRDGPALPDAHDEAHLAVFEDAARVQFGELELHRRDPHAHISNLDLACYDRQYAPAGDRALARRRHLAQWPQAVDAAIESLDRLAAPVAASLLPAVRGLTDGVDPAEGPHVVEALAAHERLVEHIDRAARTGDPDGRLGGAGLAALMGSQEGVSVDLTALADAADRERARMTELLTEGCRALDPTRTVAGLVPELLADHPDAETVIAEAAALTEEVIAFTRERRLAPHVDGEWRVGPAPASRRWATAMMTWAAPHEPDSPSWYHVTPPDPRWPRAEREEWLSIFNRTSLPAITAHEVAPGHFAHGRSLRHAPGEVRGTLYSLAFCEGWAHYAEEVFWEEGFRDGDPRYAIGVALEALIRSTRLTCAIGLHTGAMDVAEATARFERDAFLARAGAVSEARRGTFDATYGRYTWGKLELLGLRDRARTAWGTGFCLDRFHRAMLDLGSPPLGLLETALKG